MHTTQRGRKSEAAKAIPSNGHTPRALLRPPAHLSEREARLFNEVVLLAPPKQFSASDVFLLTTFSQVTSLLEDAAKAASKANDETRVQKVKALAELAKLQGSLASKLRLAPQSRTNQINTARQHDKHRPSAYDMIDWTDDGVKQT
jgi:phage terminase small subunit